MWIDRDVRNTVTKRGKTYVLPLLNMRLRDDRQNAGMNIGNVSGQRATPSRSLSEFLEETLTITLCGRQTRLSPLCWMAV